MTKFLKTFFKTMVIFFGILFLLTILAIGVVLFMGMTRTTEYFGFTISTSMQTALGITSTATFTDYVMSIIANLFAPTGGIASLKDSLISYEEVISVSLMAISSTILGLTLLFTFLHAITTERIAGIYFSKNRDKLLWQLERAQDKIEARADSLRRRK